MPYTASNYGNVRAQFLLNAEAIIALKLNADELFMMEMLYRTLDKQSLGAVVLIL
jgi:hypothetical protein